MKTSDIHIPELGELIPQPYLAYGEEVHLMHIVKPEVLRGHTIASLSVTMMARSRKDKNLICAFFQDGFTEASRYTNTRSIELLWEFTKGTYTPDTADEICSPRTMAENLVAECEGTDNAYANSAYGVRMIANPGMSVQEIYDLWERARVVHKLMEEYYA